MRDSGPRNFVYIANAATRDVDMYVQSPYEILRDLEHSDYKRSIESMFWKRVREYESQYRVSGFD